MYTKLCLSVIAMALISAGCEHKKPVAEAAGIRMENLDTTVSPREDFYRFACGGWMEKHPLTAEYARYGSFDMLAENNREQLKSLIEECAAKQSEAGSLSQKIGTLYNMAMDSARLNREGVAPIQKELEEIAAISDKAQLPAMAARLRKEGFDPYFALYVGADDKNSTMNIVHTYQSGLSLGERDYYLGTDEHNVNIRNQYQAHVRKMFQLAGFSEGEAKNAAAAVMDIETALAKVAYDKVKLRDPHANYHKMGFEELKKEVPGIDWDVYFKVWGVENPGEVNLAQKEPVLEVARIWNDGELAAQKYYMQWKVLDGAASYLSDDLVAQNFDFYGRTLSGRQQMQPRWKRAVSTVDGALGEAVGQMYVEKYFPAAAKERMVALVENLRAALGERIRGLAWMGEETKTKALEKLSTIQVKVGYPDKWKDYASLEIKEDSYWANVLRSNLFEHEKEIAEAGKPVDRSKWYMTPQTVNAYYSPSTNEICFPAGILQYPFFDMNADDAFNYGAIGVVIGHEMTHGFDDQGRLYDKDGNLKDWWTSADADNFTKRAQVLVDHFDAIEVLPGLHANGKLTLGENIADHGGLQVAYTAFKKATGNQPLPVKEGFTPEQRFFLAYANVWAGNIREEQVRVYTTTDVHSLGKWRVNGALPHIASWYEAFGIQKEDPMYLPEEQRASIW